MRDGIRRRGREWRELTNITPAQLRNLRRAFEPLIGLKINWLYIPSPALAGFEPSQIAVIVNTLLDGMLSQIQYLSTDAENAERLRKMGLSKAPGIIGEREGYPDYVNHSGLRVELKGLFVDNPALKFKRPPTPREPSARLKENVTQNIVNPQSDALLVAAVQLKEEKNYSYPFVIDIGIFSMIDVVRARDDSLVRRRGKWISGIPMVVKQTSNRKATDALTGADYEKDTNFGKLARIPYPPLQAFLKKYGAETSQEGN